MFKRLLHGAVALSIILTTTISIADVDRIHINRGVSENVESPLPKVDIERFVQAIAIIKHYYIKKEKSEKLFNSAIQGMVSSLDPHSAYLSKAALKDLQSSVSGKFVGVGIEITNDKGAIRVIAPLDGTPAFKAGIKAKDLIFKIDGKLVENLTLRQAVDRIKGKKGTTVTLSVIRKGENKPLEFKIKRDTIKMVAVKSKLLESGYGYVRIAFFQGPVSRELKQKIRKLTDNGKKKLSGLVIDLRNNPGGLLDESAKVADLFLNANKKNAYHNLIVYTKGRIDGSDIKLKARSKDMIQGTPIVVLINSGSASASEIVAGALQDYHRAIIMGTRSFGKGSVQTVIPIVNDGAIKITTALYYTPAGREIQAEGILPDVVVPELSIENKNKDKITIDEDDFNRHLVGKKEKKTQAEKLKETHKSEMALAKSDYQLYQALMMLKGVRALSQAGR